MSAKGDMLRIARQLRGFQQNEVCARLGANASDLSRIENGAKDPDPALIVEAAKVYGLPESFFEQTETIYGAPISLHEPAWRKKADVLAGDVKRVVAELNVRIWHLRKLLEATDLEPIREVPRFDADSYDNNAALIAEMLRRYWLVPSGPIRDLTALVEEAGIVVAHYDFAGSGISGVTFRVPGMPPLVVLNSGNPSDRMRFTLAHELGHIVMHKFPTPNMENEADQFASCFLVPTDDVRPYFKGRRVDLQLLAAMKPEWKVSMGSLVFAAERAGQINKAQKTYLWKQFSFQNIRLREPPELDFPREQPKILSDLLSLHMNELGYSITDLADVMHMHEDEVAQIYSIQLPGKDQGRSGHLRIVK
ncbi:helix-turn-helix domain-containing protein [Methylosinus sporium]|uniref:helix-turn-helix domain-containing protein n=1 Tax=Methylosinus sporium TaxID=428 RepID=UPI00383B97F2